MLCAYKIKLLKFLLQSGWVVQTSPRTIWYHVLLPVWPLHPIVFFSTRVPFVVRMMIRSGMVILITSFLCYWLGFWISDSHALWYSDSLFPYSTHNLSLTLMVLNLLLFVLNCLKSLLTHGGLVHLLLLLKIIFNAAFYFKYICSEFPQVRL